MAKISDTTDTPTQPLGAAEAILDSGMGEAMMKDSQEAMKEITAGGHEWMGWARKAYQANLKAWQAMMGARTVKAVAAVQTDLMKEHVKLMMDNNHRVTQAMVKASGVKPVRPTKA